MKLASTFALTAIAAAVSVLSALPAEAMILATRGTGPAFKNGLPATGIIDFQSNSSGAFPAFDYGDISFAGLDARINEEGGNRFLTLTSIAPGTIQTSVSTFNIDYKPVDSFGFRLLQSTGNANFTISFLLGSTLVESFTLTSLLALPPTGVDYFNFVAQSDNFIFDQIVFTRTRGRIEIDDVAYRIVPTPALLPGIIGMGIAAIKKRRDGALEETEADAEA